MISKDENSFLNYWKIIQVTEGINASPSAAFVGCWPLVIESMKNDYHLAHKQREDSFIYKIEIIDIQGGVQFINLSNPNRPIQIDPDISEIFDKQIMEDVLAKFNGGILK